MALENAGARPRGKGSFCRRDRGFRVFGARACIFSDDIIGVRRIDVRNAVSADPFAGDQVLVKCHGVSSS